MSKDGLLNLADSLTPAPGTYALALHLVQPTLITVGALGMWRFPAGYYVYVGSAWGAGGLAARVGRHLRGDGKCHWHIDYLRYHATPVAVRLAPQARVECVWARAFLAHPAATVIAPRFGASDCACPTHLVYVGTTKLFVDSLLECA